MTVSSTAIHTARCLISRQCPHRTAVPHVLWMRARWRPHSRTQTFWTLSTAASVSRHRGNVLCPFVARSAASPASVGSIQRRRDRRLDPGPAEGALATRLRCAFLNRIVCVCVSKILLLQSDTGTDSEPFHPANTSPFELNLLVLLPLLVAPPIRVLLHDVRRWSLRPEIDRDRLACVAG